MSEIYYEKFEEDATWLISSCESEERQ